MILPLVAAGALGMALGIFALRLRFVRSWPHASLYLAAGAGLGATIVGTVADISGVLLAGVVLATGAYAMWRSSWRLGDLAILVLVVGSGIAIGYIVAAAIDPETGSYGDQSALLVVGIGVVLSIATIVVEGIRFAIALRVAERRRGEQSQGAGQA